MSININKFTLPNDETTFFHIWNEQLDLVFDEVGNSYNSCMAYNTCTVELVYFAQLPSVVKVKVLQEQINKSIQEQKFLTIKIQNLFSELQRETNQH